MTPTEGQTTTEAKGADYPIHSKLGHPTNDERTDGVLLLSRTEYTKTTAERYVCPNHGLNELCWQVVHWCRRQIAGETVWDADGCYMIPMDEFDAIVKLSTGAKTP